MSKMVMSTTRKRCSNDEATMRLMIEPLRGAGTLGGGSALIDFA
jgi:hypothetical protein